ncbi:MAG: MotA/TolQ/ExbB proton channel family protein [Nevskia sp.]|nr:MotA/TolQ/ExbB proton channel family protein [Nevskia sp.]
MKAFRLTASAGAHRQAEALRSNDPPGAGWHRWLLIFGGIAYGLYVSHELGWLELLAYGDPTWLTFGIIVLFVLASLYCGTLAFQLARQHEIWTAVRNGQGHDGPSWTTDFLAERQALNGADATALGDLLHERIKGRTELGWFSAGLQIKLGLLGTVIGFVIMLASIGSANDLQSQGLDALIRSMGIGMKVSLYTTIVGLIGSMMIGIQMLVIDRAADRLFALIITLPDPSAAD